MNPLLAFPLREVPNSRRHLCGSRRTHRLSCDTPTNGRTPVDHSASGGCQAPRRAEQAGVPSFIHEARLPNPQLAVRRPADRGKFRLLTTKTNRLSAGRASTRQITVPGIGQQSIIAYKRAYRLSALKDCAAFHNESCQASDASTCGSGSKGSVALNEVRLLRNAGPSSSASGAVRARHRRRPGPRRAGCGGRCYVATGDLRQTLSDESYPLALGGVLP